MNKVSRRSFLALGAGALSACGRKTAPMPSFTGGMVGPSAAVGHLLREAALTAPGRIEKKSVVIVGGGIAGLSAARQLRRRGFDDFVLLELEESVGGNSRFAENAVSASPWGAHYVPLPSAECLPVVELFKELGVITGVDAMGRPIYNEFYLCAEPSERLFMNGRWQEGLLPITGVSRDDKKQYETFAAAMEVFRNARGTDGKRAFLIPVDECSQDATYVALDRQTMADFMTERGWNSQPLRWYVDYCCRDDFGARADRVSAWAGVHYFASRGGVAANTTSQTVLTWPEGNGWLVKQLRRPVDARIRTKALTYNIQQDERNVFVDVMAADATERVRIEADRAIFCAPRFVANRVVAGLKERTPMAPHYAPWVVANLTLAKLPTGSGEEPAWDNVFYDSDSLGYVVATHQNPARTQQKTVITYYRALCDQAPIEARNAAHQRTYKEWCDSILADLETAHRGITADVENLDVCVWGHGMVAPLRGFVWSEERRAMQAPLGRVHFAHSDMSGISLFEEAYIRGLRAADEVMARLS